MTRSFSTLCIALALFSGCKNSGSTDDSDAPIQAPANALFELLSPEKTGISFANTLKEDFQNNIMSNNYLYNGGGVAVIDVNRDGLPDLYFTATMAPNRLYLNKGNLKFEDITDRAGVALPVGIKTGVTVVDINNDGWQDLYVCRTGQVPADTRRNVLFVNQKNGSFKEETAAWGLHDPSASNHANFFDMDLDGDLDCYIINHPVDFKSVNSADATEKDGKYVRNTAPRDVWDSNRLLRNEGTDYSDWTEKGGVLGRAWSLSVSVSDLNGDNWPDIYVANDYVAPDFTWINNRNGTFTDRNQQFFRHTAQHTMGVDIADLNNDGLVDLVGLDMLAPDNLRQKQLMSTMLLDRYGSLVKFGHGHQNMRNVLQLNNGDDSFSEIGNLAGMAETDWSWSPLLMDVDNDGWRDLFITNGYRRDVSNMDYVIYTADSIKAKHGGITKAVFPTIGDYLKLIPEKKLANYFFRNTGGIRLENATTGFGFVEKSWSNGSAFADLDRDGDMDLIVNNIDEPAFVYQNQAADRKTGSWLQLSLEGSPKNTQAVGASVRLRAGGQVFYEELNPVRGFFSSSEMLLHFGLGQIQKVDFLEIRFPDGRMITQSQVPVNQRLNLKWADAKPGAFDILPAAGRRFFGEKTGGAGLVFQHVEDDFLDFNRERLIPHKMSTPGPSLAVGDANGDGLDDVFIGGAAGQGGAIFLQSKSSTFSKMATAVFENDKASEDTGAAFFDADGDGDQDLLVASGGNTSAAGSTVYEARLYQNDGKGSFSKTQNALPKTTESCTAISLKDFDGDGDLDIFLAGAVVPGAWPMPPKSFILKNEKGQFSDATAAVSPDFSKIGMVKALEWADLDGDKTDELIAVGDFMPVVVFKMEGGKFVNATSRFGLEKTGGFWRSVIAGDFDGDGDQDLVCGNYGLNSRLQPVENQPLVCYANDFDSNGSLDPVIGCYQNGICWPLAQRDIFVKQMPSLKKKWLRNEPFARACLTDIFAQSALDKALKLEATTLANTFFENTGGGKFTARPLPAEAQISPIFSFLKTDLDSDGDLDLVAVGNDFGPQVETGRLDAGNGLVLLNDGKANFSTPPSRQTGLRASRESRDVKAVKLANGKRLLLVANSNDGLQVFDFQ